MKIKTLTQNQKISFKNEMPKYEVFLKEKLPHLATTSLSLYKRTLSYISTINKCNDKTVEETCIFLTSKLLTDTSLDCVIGDSNVSESNKNIRLSAFKNLVEIFRDEIKLKISPVILRNEYKSLYLHIGDNQPTSTSKNYIWIKLDSNDHKIIINKNKTTGGVKRKNLGDFIGHTSVYPQKNQKTFPLNKEIAKIIIFIKQVFNERSDKPFIKCNNRELNYTSSTWSKMLQRVFKKINPKLSSNLIRKIYQLKIDTTEDLSNQDKMLIYEMNDLHRDPKNLKDNKEDEENLVMTLDNYL